MEVIDITPLKSKPSLLEITSCQIPGRLFATISEKFYSDSSGHSESRQPYNHALHTDPEYTLST